MELFLLIWWLVGCVGATIRCADAWRRNFNIDENIEFKTDLHKWFLWPFYLGTFLMLGFWRILDNLPNFWHDYKEAIKMGLVIFLVSFLVIGLVAVWP